MPVFSSFCLIITRFAAPESAAAEKLSAALAMINFGPLIFARDFAKYILENNAVEQATATAHE
jgi:hypothetical protein